MERRGRNCSIDGPAAGVSALNMASMVCAHHPIYVGRNVTNPMLQGHDLKINKIPRSVYISCYFNLIFALGLNRVPVMKIPVYSSGTGYPV
jgi:hypothetical protein